MQTAKMTSKGQITVPAEIRKKLGLQEGSYVTFTEQGDAVVLSNASNYAQSANRSGFSSAARVADVHATYDVAESSALTAEERLQIANDLLGKSFLDELEDWRQDFEVADDGVAKVLGRKSKELPNLKKVSKIWG